MLARPAPAEPRSWLALFGRWASVASPTPPRRVFLRSKPNPGGDMGTASLRAWYSKPPEVEV